MEELGWRNAPESPEDWLDNKRQQIDALDETIAKLLEQRLQLAADIGRIKAQGQIPVKDNAREQQVLRHVQDAISTPAVAAAAIRVYKQILSESRNLQVQTPQVESGAEATKLYFPKVLIVGCGLIGAALARQIRRASPQTEIIGCDAASVLDKALSAGIIDQAASDCEKVAAVADLIILAASPKANLQLLRKIAPLTAQRQVIVDVTSTKNQICKLAGELDLAADFVGGHPLFGSEKSGIEGSDNVVVTGKTFALVPSAKASELTMRRLTRWLEQLGMQVQITDAESHDSTVADTSHALQLMAIAVGAQIQSGTDDKKLEQKLALSGPALRAVARLMASPFPMWEEIIAQNSPALCASLLAIEKRLQLMRGAIENEQLEVIEDLFARARMVSEKLNK